MRTAGKVLVYATVAAAVFVFFRVTSIDFTDTAFRAECARKHGNDVIRQQCFEDSHDAYLRAMGFKQTP